MLDDLRLLAAEGRVAEDGLQLVQCACAEVLRGVLSVHVQKSLIGNRQKSGKNRMLVLSRSRRDLKPRGVEAYHERHAPM